MTRVKQLREHIDAKLDQWEAQATAFEAQLSMNREKAQARLEEKKQQMLTTLDQLKEKIQEFKDLAETQKTEVLGKLDHLKAQVALAKAETRDAYHAQKEKLGDAFAALEHALDSLEEKVAERLQTLTDQFIRRANALNAELDAMEIQFREHAAEVRGLWEEKKQELASKIAAFKAALEAKRDLARQKGQTFEAELAAGIQHVRDAFKHLVSS